MSRKYYMTGDLEDYYKICQQIKTVEDVYQLDFDVKQSDRNDYKFRSGVSGVWAFDAAIELGEAKRWIFLTKQAFDRMDGLADEELAIIQGYTILSDRSI